LRPKTVECNSTIERMCRQETKEYKTALIGSGAGSGMAGMAAAS